MDLCALYFLSSATQALDMCCHSFTRRPDQCECLWMAKSAPFLPAARSAAGTTPAKAHRHTEKVLEDEIVTVCCSALFEIALSASCVHLHLFHPFSFFEVDGSI